MSELDDLEKNLRDMLQKNPAPVVADKTKIDQEIAAIGALRAREAKANDLLNAKLREMDKQINDTNATIAKAKNAIRNLVPGNLSINNIPQDMNQAEERNTQWVRATYPYVDAFARRCWPNSKITWKRAKRPSTIASGPIGSRS